MNTFPMQRFFFCDSHFSVENVCKAHILFFCFFDNNWDFSKAVLVSLVIVPCHCPHHFSSLCINCSQVQELSVCDLTIILPVSWNTWPPLGWINGKVQDGFVTERAPWKASSQQNHLGLSPRGDFSPCQVFSLSTFLTPRLGEHFSKWMDFDAALQIFMQVYYLPPPEWRTIGFLAVRFGPRSAERSPISAILVFHSC